MDEGATGGFLTDERADACIVSISTPASVNLCRSYFKLTNREVHIIFYYTGRLINFARLGETGSFLTEEQADACIASISAEQFDHTSNTKAFLE